MSDLVLRFESGHVVDFRSWPVKVFNPDGSPRPEEDPFYMYDIKDAVVISPEEIAVLDKPSWK